MTGTGTQAASILWQRLDGPGHDACTIIRLAKGWLLHGAAAFSEGTVPIHMTYKVVCNAGWQTRRATIVGYIGARGYQARIERGVVWTLNGIPQPQLSGCNNIDLGFTPATNTIAIRHLALNTGTSATVRSAWLNVLEGEFSVLEQQYTRESHDRYQYESQRFNVRATLTVSNAGLVTDYPGLWTAEP